VPIMIMAGIATYFNSRASVARQSPEAAASPQTAMMNKLALYVFPLGVVAGGPFLPLAIILYWFANNIWTFGQQHYVFGRIEKEEEQKKAEAIERRAANAPAPGARPSRKKRPAVDPASDEPGSALEITAPSDGVEDTGNGVAAKSDSATEKQNSNAAARNGSVNRTPKPGARPKKRKR
jgi:YidC/Oxa1 family membrane protein insertase